MRTRSPRHTLSLLAGHHIAGLNVSVIYYHTDQFYWNAGCDYPSKYNRLNLRLARDWKTAAGKFQVALVIQNLIGRKFESTDKDFYERQEFERRSYLSLKYEFR